VCLSVAGVPCVSDFYDNFVRLCCICLFICADAYTCANAFEQILEELTPKLHKAMRGFCDNHGFPLSKLIKTKAAADFVYIVMKPLEWFFLVGVYFLQ